MPVRPRRTPESLRSMRWFGPDDLRSFGHRSRAKQMGYWREEFTGRPVIGIVNTWNELNTCHTHFPERVEDIRRGVLEAGGFPVELPAFSLRRADDEADHHAVPQFPGDGDGGTDPRAPDRRRGADGRLRQDHAGGADGRALGQRPRDLRPRRPDAARPLA